MAFIPALFAALLIYSISTSAVQSQQSCTNGDVRLADGSSKREGRLEVCIGGVWGTVCYDGWGSTDSGVVCRQLGYSYEGANSYPAFASPFIGFGTGPIHMSFVRCDGTESQLLNCPYSTSFYDIYIFCDHFYDVVVNCQRGTEIDSVVEYNITDADTDIEAIRLINGDDNTNSGRLELLYNGTWGTVCDRLWSSSDAKVACRMIGYDDAACAITTNYFGRANSTVPFWMDSVQCTGSEEVLDNCSFSGWGTHSCSHNINDAGIVCANTSEIGTPSDIQLVESTTTTLNISWTVPQLPNLIETDNIRYQILYNDRTRTFYPPTNSGGSDSTTTEQIYTLTSLTRDTEYTIQIRVEVDYHPCSAYVLGNYSDSVSFRTNATRKQSTLQVRLISPFSDLDFMGRIEVFYNNEWGTVCNDFFDTVDGNVVCQMLNFTMGALCIPSSSRSFPRGTGQIWLDNVRCTSTDEVLEDCDHNGWGNHNCGHSDDVGVICRTTFPPVMNLTVVSTTTSSITLRWNRYTFPRGFSTAGYIIRYTTGSIARSTTLSRSRTTYTLRNLGFEQTYNITVRARVRYRYCFAYLYGDYSNEVSIMIMEAAPDGPPTSFNLVVINSTAIEAVWELPEINLRNGIIRGYKLFVQSMGRDIRNVTITNNQTLAYIVGGLQRSTPYTFSILAYTVADGPRSIHLTAVTLFRDPLITGFGINGNGIDKVTKQTYNSGFNVHCTVSSDPSITTTDWFFANGSKVGLSDLYFREGHFNNGTTVLQIGVDRSLTYCDGGNYTCIVNTTSGRTEKRSFHLLIRNSPPSPSRPSAIEIMSTSITIDWSQSTCDGGHITKAFNIRYRRPNSFSSTYSYITVADSSQRRHKITELNPSTLYEFSVQAITFDTRISSYSPRASFSTLPPAPSVPRDVQVRLITPSLAEVSWRTPALPNGVITHYTVYAVPQLSHEETRSKRQAATLPRTIKKVFPSTSRAGNISLMEHSITYQFQVSASINSDQTSNEGDLSPISPSTALYIPSPGLPKPVNLRMINFTNTSITVGWEYPPPPIEAIQNFLVAYIGEVEWISPGELVMFEDSGEISVTDTTVTVSPLIPGTNYLIRVSAVTQSGRGAEVTRYGITRISLDEKLAFFQLRMSPVSSCLSFVDPSKNITDRLLKVRRAIIQELDTRVCPTCGLTISNIRNDEFSCHGGLKNRIVYRAMIIGTDTYSATDLVSLIQSWITSGSASITVFSSRLRFDKDCTAFLDTLNDPDCPFNAEPQQTATAPKSTERINMAPTASSDHVRAAEIGGFFIGAIIIILLAVLILVIVIVAMKKYKCKSLSFKNNVKHDRMFDASFSDIGSTKESINFDANIDSKEN